MRHYTLASNYPSACRIPHLENNFYIYGENPPIIRYPEPPRYPEPQMYKRINQFSNTQEVMRYHYPQSFYPPDNFAQTADYSFNPNNREYYLNQEVKRIQQRRDFENLENSRWKGDALRLKDLENEQRSQRYRQCYQYKQENAETPQYQPYDQHNNLRTYRNSLPANSSKSSNFTKSDTIPRNVLQNGSSSNFYYQNAKSNSVHAQENRHGYRNSSEDLVDCTGDFGRTAASESLKSSNSYKKILRSTELNNIESRSFMPTKSSKSFNYSNSKIYEKNTSENYQKNPSQNLEDERGRNEGMGLKKDSNSSFRSKNEGDPRFYIDDDDKSNYEGVNLELNTKTSMGSKSFDNLEIKRPSKELPNNFKVVVTSETSSDRDASLNPQASDEFKFQPSGEFQSQPSKDLLRIPGKGTIYENNFAIKGEDLGVVEEQKVSKSSKKLNGTGVKPSAKGVKGKKPIQTNALKKTQQKHHKSVSGSKGNASSNRLNKNIGEVERDDDLTSNISSGVKLPYEPHYLKSTFSCEIKSMDNKPYSYNK